MPYPKLRRFENISVPYLDTRLFDSCMHPRVPRDSPRGKATAPRAPAATITALRRCPARRRTAACESKSRTSSRYVHHAERRAAQSEIASGPSDLPEPACGNPEWSHHFFAYLQAGVVGSVGERLKAPEVRAHQVGVEASNSDHDTGQGVQEGLLHLWWARSGQAEVMRPCPARVAASRSGFAGFRFPQGVMLLASWVSMPATSAGAVVVGLVTTNSDACAAVNAGPPGPWVGNRQEWSGRLRRLPWRPTCSGQATCSAIPPAMPRPGPSADRRLACLPADLRSIASSAAPSRTAPVWDPVLTAARKAAAMVC